MDVLRLKKSNCKNCYKCIRHCPVKSIRFSANQAHIIKDECILCGQCFVVCPQNAKEVRDDIEKTRVLIDQGKTVVASIAPSFVSNYGVSISSMREALLKLGFSYVEETAIGATLVKQRYDDLVLKADEPIISSCCPAVNWLITKHLTAATTFLAPVPTPMSVHCEDIKSRYKDASVVFIGPCIAKKSEGDKEGVDAVLTFEELSAWLCAKEIKLCGNKDEPFGRARSFPIPGGIISSMDCARTDYDYIKVDGFENCIDAINDVINGNLKRCFIEMSACSGSCAGGPLMEKKNPISSQLEVNRYTSKEDFKTDKSRCNLSKSFQPEFSILPAHSEEKIGEVLVKMGKVSSEQELNCGSCGYDSCRQKASAIIDGKAQFSMCLPFLQEKSETFSSLVVNSSPNGIIVLNEELEIQEMNAAALKMMSIRRVSDVLGEPIVRLLDPKPFEQTAKDGAPMREKKVYLTDYQKHVAQTIVYDKNYKLHMCILRDITREEELKVKKETINKKTLETADNVVEKQMRIVQEIASLLGETAAETKIALTNLKELLKDE